ncbi:MAG: hypothetical protein AAF438_08975 [Pseudomonadota bacterium]
MYSRTYVERGITAQKFRADTAFAFRAANEINRNLPMMLDRDTRLDTTVGTSQYFGYYFTMLNISKDDLSIAEFEDLMYTSIANDICKKKIFQDFRENGINVRFTYRDMDGLEITTLEVDAATCAAAPNNTLEQPGDA